MGCGTFPLDLGEGFPGGGVDRLDLCRGDEPPDDHVALAGIQLDAVASPSGLLGGDQLDRLHGGVKR